MQFSMLLLIASIVVAYNMHLADAKFSFALPGKWGASAKRGGPFSFSLPGRWGNSAKRDGSSGPLSCEHYDPEAVYAIYTILQQEGQRLAACMEKPANMENEVNPEH